MCVKRRARALCFAVLALAAVPAMAAKKRAPLVLLVSFDTLRADHLGCYGYAAPTTPRIDALALDGVKVLRAYAPQPHTTSSHMSLLTGFYPEVHDVRHVKGGKILSPKIRTLAEHLKAAGYRSEAVVCPSNLPEGLGFGRGFERYETVKFDLTFADSVNDKALDVLRSWKRGRKRFLFLHYYDPHMDTMLKGNRLPFYAPPEFARRFLPDGESRLDYCVTGRCASDYLNFYSYLSTAPMPAAQRAELPELYDGGIAYMDAAFGRIVDELKRARLYDDALIIVTADHGTEFGEHGEYIHNQVYEESVRVPLLIKLPGNKFAGNEIREPVSSVDIMPTILALAGVQPGGGVQGESLVPAIDGTWARRGAVVSQGKIHPEDTAAWGDGYKLIVSTATGKRALYDLRSAGAEGEDVALREPAEADRLARELDAWRKSCAELREALDSPAGRFTPSDEELQRLKELGYAR